MKSALVAIAILALLIYGVYAVFGKSASSASTLATAIPAAPGTGGHVVAEAKIVPVQSAALSFQAGGIVHKVLVKTGDHVQSAQTLAWLDTTPQLAAVGAAEADLAQAQPNYQDLRSGASPEEMAVAEAQLRQA
jgi:HlyD family secretion protein